jgi:hypothetical protein
LFLKSKQYILNVRYTPCRAQRQREPQQAASVLNPISRSPMTELEPQPCAAVASAPAGAGGTAGRQRPLRGAPGRAPPVRPNLLAEEEMLNDARLGGGLGYSPRRHVQVMSALMCGAVRRCLSLR